MKSSHRKLGTIALAGAGAAAGGYFVGKSIDTRRTALSPSSPWGYATVLLPALIGAAGWFFLRKKSPNVSKGLLYGGLAGSAYGYFKLSQAQNVGPGAVQQFLATGPLATPPVVPGVASLTAGTGATRANANTGAATMSPSTASTATARFMGAARRRGARGIGASLVPGPTAPGVRRALNSKFGSGLGDAILPKKFQTGSAAFWGDAWSRR